MKTAISISGNRLAPLFDVAQSLLVLDWQEGVVLARHEWLGQGSPLSILTDLKAMGVQQLVCGAISRPVQELAQFLQIDCKGFLTGELNEIINALIGGQLDQERWAMPGCHLRGARRGHGGRRGCGRRKRSIIKES